MNMPHKLGKQYLPGRNLSLDDGMTKLSDDVLPFSQMEHARKEKDNNNITLNIITSNVHYQVVL